jgi:putative multiple sugar transport system substrate-binding protein
MKKLIAAAMAAAMLGSMTSCGKEDGAEKNNAKKTVGIAMPSVSLERWNRDGQFLKEQFEKAGYQVNLKYSQDDATKQNNDIYSMLNDGVDLLLVGAVDGNNLTKPLDEAKSKGIPVVAYDRLIMNTNAVTYYVSFDNYTVGELQGNFVRDQLGLEGSGGPYNIEFVGGDPGDNNATYFFNGAYDVLKSYINSGKLVVPSGKTTFERVATEGWTTENAENNMKDTLSSYYKERDIDVVLCSNDSTALGVTKAIDSSYKGSVQPIITGQDGDIENLRNIVDGKQAMTVYKNVRDEASVTYEVCKMILDGEIPTSKLVEKLPIDVSFDSESYNNGVKYVQSYLLLPSVITKDNMQLLVDCGLYEWDSAHKYLELTKTS